MRTCRCAVTVSAELGCRAGGVAPFTAVGPESDVTEPFTKTEAPGRDQSGSCGTPWTVKRSVPEAIVVVFAA
jgi:hypothetical protein